MRRPPLRHVPLWAPCSACGLPLRTTVSFLDEPPRAELDCPWCYETVVVEAPTG